MAESSRNFDVNQLISFGNDLVKVFQDPNDRDLNDLSQCLQHSHSISSNCNSDLDEARSLFQDYQNKIDSHKQKIEEARSETAADAELELLQRELDEELEKERMLKEEFRAISNEFNDLEQQRISVKEQKNNLLKIEQEKTRTRMLLSMYASVTNIVPNMDDQSKISGYIVEKEKNAVEKFEYDTSQMTSLDICNGIWKTISD
ncbi:kinetochore protein SPC24 homolog [Cicer arietinum]|uniref:Kinetochore protein SPC24 homolog n=1 Tax=Cicer arietinum TaxID=3827 RepID=A0A1S2XRI7_CICAR|nr:kinetochore protein SPC24 homolog [Cicer arietinum]